MELFSGQEGLGKFYKARSGVLTTPLSPSLGDQGLGATRLKVLVMGSGSEWLESRPKLDVN